MSYWGRKAGNVIGEIFDLDQDGTIDRIEEGLEMQLIKEILGEDDDYGIKGEDPAEDLYDDRDGFF